MNRRALKLVIAALIVATLGVVPHPGSPSLTRSSDKQAEAAHSKRRSAATPTSSTALNEQMHRRRTSCAQGERSHRAADALVAAAKAKT